MADIPFPEQNREQRPVKQQAMQRAVQPAAYESPQAQTVDVAAEANFFAAMSNIGFGLYKLMQTREASNQLSRAQGDIRAGVFGYERWGRENPYDPDNELIEFNSQMAGVHERINSYLTNPVAKREFQNWYVERQPGLADAAMQRSFLIDKNLKRAQAMQRLDLIKNTNFGSKETLDEGLEAIDEIGNDMIQQGLLSPTELAGNAIMLAQLKREKVAGWAKQQIEGQSRQLAVGGGWKEAIKFISNPKNQQGWSKEYGIGLSEIKKITTDLNTMFAAEDRVNKEELEQQREKDRDVISKAIKAIDPNTDTIIENSSLDETEQSKWSDRWEKKASGKDIVRDNIVYGQLYDKSLDVGRGLVKFSDFKNELIKNLNKLGDGDYEYLLKNASEELKVSQNNFLSRMSTEAGRLIVDYKEKEDWAEILKTFKDDVERNEAIDNRKLQFWFLSQFNQELREYILANPDLDDKQRYQYAEMLKHQYWTTSQTEIEERLKEARTARPKATAEMLKAAKEVVKGEEVSTKEDLMAEARATTDIEERKRIYEQGKKLGYWE